MCECVCLATPYRFFFLQFFLYLTRIFFLAQRTECLLQRTGFLLQYNTIQVKNDLSVLSRRILRNSAPQHVSPPFFFFFVLKQKKEVWELLKRILSTKKKKFIKPSKIAISCSPQVCACVCLSVSLSLSLDLSLFLSLFLSLLLSLSLPLSISPSLSLNRWTGKLHSIYVTTYHWMWTNQSSSSSGMRGEGGLGLGFRIWGGSRGQIILYCFHVHFLYYFRLHKRKTAARPFLYLEWILLHR